MQKISLNKYYILLFINCYEIVKLLVNVFTMKISNLFLSYYFFILLLNIYLIFLGNKHILIIPLMVLYTLTNVLYWNLRLIR